MKGHLLVISKTCYVLVMDKLFPRFDDGLEKCRLDFCFYIQICSCIGLSDLNSFLLLMWVCLNVLNKNKFRMTTLLLKLILLKLRLQLQNPMFSCTLCKHIWISERVCLFIWIVSWEIDSIKVFNNSKKSWIITIF